MYIYVCIYTYSCTCIFFRSHIYTYCRYMNVCTYMYICTYICIHMYMYVCVCTSIYSCIYMDMDMYSQTYMFVKISSFLLIVFIQPWQRTWEQEEAWTRAGEIEAEGERNSQKAGIWNRISQTLDKFTQQLFYQFLKIPYGTRQELALHD